MSSLDSLPFDVFDCILKCECISFVDICRFSCVSKIFNSIATNNTLWKSKYKEMWPDLAALYDVSNTDWRSLFKKQYCYRRLVFKNLSELSRKFYHTENISDEEYLCFIDIVQQEKFGFEILINEFENILNDSNSHLNLTHKYYAKKALKFVNHGKLKLLWQELLSQPLNNFSLVEGACLVSRWHQPTNPKCTANVSSQITDIAIRVLKLVKQHYPNHPVVEHGLTDKILTESLWIPSQCKYILDCVNSVLFKELNFHIIQSLDDEEFKLCSILIDKVLDKRTGHLILGIIYAAVAGKLGVFCLPVNFLVDFPPTMYLKWLEYPLLTGKKEAYTVIDVLDCKLNCKLIDLERNLHHAGNMHIPTFLTENVQQQNLSDDVPLAKFFSWIARHPLYLMPRFGDIDIEDEDALALCDSLLLLCLLNPENMELKLWLATLYTQLGINSTEAISIFHEISAHASSSHLTRTQRFKSTLYALENVKFIHPPIKPNHRIRDDKSKHVKFAVGMIMRHRKYNYRCVIYGWDPVCKANLSWIKQMGVYNLAYKDKQPFYQVLVSDGTTRYAAEENLEILKGYIPVDHIQIGRYFESFHDNYYLPNEPTKSEYPDDMSVRESALCSTENY